MNQRHRSRLRHKIRNKPTSLTTNNAISNQLFEAIKHRNLGEVRRLVEEVRVDPNVVSEKGQTVLHAACHGDCLSIVKYLVSRHVVDVEARDGEMRTPLLTACYAGRTEVARFLVEKGGADVNARDSYMCTPLHYACSVELSRYRLHSFLSERQGEDDVGLGRFELVKFLVEEGRANVQAQDNSGIAPLHIACFYGSFSLVKYLVEEKGADVNVLSFKGTPFHHACRWRRTEVIGYLVSKCRVDAKVLKYAWVQPDSLGPRELTWDLKASLLESYIRDSLGRSVLYARTHPIHVILQCPVPSEDALFDCMTHMDDVFYQVMDEHGRLPLHMALTMASTNSTITPTLIRSIVESEPRAASVRDASTGFLPFQSAACSAGYVVGCCECVEHEQDYEMQSESFQYMLLTEDIMSDCDDNSSVMSVEGQTACEESRQTARDDRPSCEWLDLVYRLLRSQDPMNWLASHRRAG